MWKQFLSFNLNQFNLYYLTAALAVAAGGIFLITSRSPSETQPPERTLPEIPALRDEEPGTGEEIIQEPQDPDPGSIPVTAASPGISRDETGKTTEEDPGETGQETMQEIQSAGPEPAEVEAEPEVIPEESISASISFTASRSSGCAPLAVDFTNASVNGEKYLWNFGDGGSSTESDPSYVFDESGLYTVTLHMTGKNGLEYLQQQDIRIFETPTASFEVDEDVNLEGPVYFYNYSRSADQYRWDFGDKQGSTQSDPVHYYGQPGTYHVKLVVWTEDQCYDSLTIFNAFRSEENSIRFPNAFTPNQNGPSGGYYNGNDIGNTIFHPVVDGELVEYRLSIFNRFGVLLFESTDLQIGWDGYYQEELAPQDVYIWKARGKFSNGKTFVESGDVTLVKTL
jgi:gliding motility-associated-like protein